MTDVTVSLLSRAMDLLDDSYFYIEGNTTVNPDRLQDRINDLRDDWIEHMVDLRSNTP